MMQVNLLPWREQARQIKKMNFAIAVAACAAAACFFVLIWHVFDKSLVSNQNQRNEFLQAELSKEQAILNDLNKRKQQQIADVASLQFIFSLQQTGYQLVRLFNALAEVTPETVTFNRISREGDIVIILGKARSNLQITTLLKNMGKNPLFQQPELTAITGKEIATGEERLFQLKVRIGQ